MDKQRLVDPLAMAFLRSLTAGQLDRLRSIIRAQRPVAADDLRSIPGLRDLLDQQAGGDMALSDPIRTVLADLLTRADLSSPAMQRLDASPFVAITKGAETAKTWVADFDEAQVATDLNLGLFKVVQALKTGDLARADAVMTVLAEHFDIPALEQCGPGYEPELSCVLFMKAIYSDRDISEQALDRLFEMLANLPKDASLLRAILYNVSLDVFLRQQKMSEAEGAAHRALFHYGAAGESGVAFYVHLYLTVIRLWDGDLAGAGQRLADARQALAQFEGAVTNDTLLLRSFTMIIAYEAGDSGAFIKHLMSEDDTVPFGELWPSIADPIISYGRRALANKVSPAAALSWVRRWRVRQHRSRRFDALISAQEALALQDLGRWQEADELLADIDASDDAEVRLARFASGLGRTPKSPGLARQIADSLKAPHLSVRHSVMLRLLAAQSAIARGIEREGARHLSAAINSADPEAMSVIWEENSQLVSAILAKRDLRTELNRFPRLRRQIQALSRVETRQRPSALTHQEFHVLQLLAEAQSNKAIGLRLGIALPTVKFHVKNLCRKTQTTNRGDVVRVAIEAGWLSDV